MYAILPMLSWPPVAQNQNGSAQSRQETAVTRGAHGDPSDGQSSPGKEHEHLPTRMDITPEEVLFSFCAT